MKKAVSKLTPDTLIFKEAADGKYQALPVVGSVDHVQGALPSQRAGHHYWLSVAQSVLQPPVPAWLDERCVPGSVFERAMIPKPGRRERGMGGSVQELGALRRFGKKARAVRH